ncbi:TIGR03619 family F420-dependent LLM class oxidoreductase [Yinghuangia seranimata]|uniref:TIGR03619 family F420-dependent LLM class oxidoreductase n=1 Tax=Yinghuangia seranimata TaxID=408067 RepID=UPI00248B6A22|nr:TIGR03619 family F420-dependent LLM class oxidoreductase [Yinghuangia seranimata]MDI2132734.1 TIGR03619 family F420-dependent LLM class oxidoreductase [Yinghuangia seranimata]
MTPPRLVLVLSENWTLTDPRDLRSLVDMAREAEDAGFDAVMVSEHIVLGKGADANGLMANPRDYALPGNQDPATPWPDSLTLLTAIAAATTRLRLVAAGVIAPLRHPLVLAQELAALDLLSEGRLVVQPIVSWHEPEYAALGVPFRRRGRLLDAHLAAWETLWRDTPASFDDPDYPFEDVYLVPKPYRPDGPRLWFGGSSVHGAVLRRLVRYGHGFHPLGQPSDEELGTLRTAFTVAGRDPGALEMVGGIRPTFPDDHSPAPIAPALESIPGQMARGFTTICVKPSQYTDERVEVGPLCREIVRRTAAL